VACVQITFGSLLFTLPLPLAKDMPDKSGLALGGIGIGVKTNRFTLRFSDDASKPIALYADDAQTKSEWLQGFVAFHLRSRFALLVLGQE